MTKKEYLEILSELKKIIVGTEWEGHLFAVGGCVRDSIMDDYPIKDVDLVVDLPNGGIEFANWLCQNHYLVYEPVTYPTYGTAMFKLLKFPELELEVVETRKEQYKDKESRNPDVVYGSLEEDCMRRDLTINALYYDITNEKIIDLVGGMDDITNHIIKTPTDPDIIYDDDPLRMLRCCRFSGRYGWKIDETAQLGIQRNVKRLEIITQERITDEIIKSLMTAILPSMPFGHWEKYGLMDVMFPEFKERKQKSFTNIKRHMNRLQTEFGDALIPELYFAAMFKDDLGILKQMKLSNAFVNLTEKIATSLNFMLYNVSDYNVRMFGVMFGEHTDLCIGFISAYIKAYTPGSVYDLWLKYFTDKVKELRKDGTMFDHMTSLPIDGNDIMEVFNLKPSKEIKTLLDVAWEYYYSHPKATKEDFISFLYGITK